MLVYVCAKGVSLEVRATPEISSKNVFSQNRFDRWSECTCVTDSRQMRANTGQ